MSLFKHLSDEEQRAYREWARENYRIYSPIQGIWHPVVQDECVKMNAETGYSPSEDIAMRLLADYEDPNDE
jgi:tRNA uridine 5-carbamoylmethylation protein Kti12